jgi:LemA protein
VLTGSVVFWLAVAVLLFWWLGAYNRLVRLRSQVISRFADVEQRMDKALVLLGEAAAAPPAGAGDASGGAAAGTDPESAAVGRAGLHAVMLQFEVALRVAARHPLDASAVAALQTAYATVHVVWERRNAEWVQPPPTPVAVMQRAWEDNTQVVREAAAGYNTAVADYNDAIRQFPASVLAYFFGFAPAAAL